MKSFDAVYHKDNILTAPLSKGSVAKYGGVARSDSDGVVTIVCESSLRARETLSLSAMSCKSISSSSICNLGLIRCLAISANIYLSSFSACQSLQYLARNLCLCR
jgi:hypothetical protein